MLIDDILKKLELDKSKNGYFTFETFILNLLKVHQEKNNKPFSQSSRSFGFDAYAPNGIDEIRGGTYVEIKIDLDRAPIRSILEQIFNLHSRLPVEKRAENVLIISAKHIRSSRREIALNTLLNDNYPLKVFLWGPEEINKIVNKNRKEVNEIINNLFSLRIESAVVQSEKDWKKEREEKIKTLRFLYDKGQFSFFLGAGVSSSAGMPDWTTLLNSLFVTYLTKEFGSESKIKEEDINQIVKRLNKIDEPSALMAARYLRKGLDSKQEESEEFTKTISRNLYKLRNTNKKIDSKLIRSIVELCIPQRTGAKVKSVITYNFDDLIERQLTNQTVRHHSFYSDNEYLDPDELPVYHVHGFYPKT